MSRQYAEKRNRTRRSDYRDEETSRRRSRSRSRSKSRSRRRPNSSHREVAENTARLQKLETMIENLLRRDSTSSEPSQTLVRMTVKSDCIPQFTPGKPNQSALKWVNKIDQLAQVNRWDESTTVQLMQNRLAGLARTWYENLTTYTYS